MELVPLLVLVIITLVSQLTLPVRGLHQADVAEKDLECSKLDSRDYMPEQEAKKLEEKLGKCLNELMSMTEDYAKMCAKQAGLSVQSWLEKYVTYDEASKLYRVEVVGGRWSNVKRFAPMPQNYQPPKGNDPSAIRRPFEGQDAFHENYMKLVDKLQLPYHQIKK